jgi:hemolysin III
MAPGHTAGEELANRLTHSVGLVYVFSLVTLYAASTLYHSVRRPRLKRVLRLLDHGAIFLLIAGTYTPISLIVLRGGLGWTLTGTAWTLAALGIFWKIRSLERRPILGPVFYLAMGWIAVLALPALLQALTGPQLAWLLAGGAAYSVGVIFYAWGQLPFNHAIWHLFVLAGSACHFLVLALRLSSSA